MIRVLSLVLIFLTLSLQAVADSPHHGLAILEYHQQSAQQKKTTLFADRLREQFQREKSIAVLPKPETEEVFFYHRRSLVEGRENRTENLLEKGKKLYFELRLEEAVKVLNQAIETGRAKGELAYVDAHIILGLTLFALDRPDEAKKAFAEALRLDPTRELDSNFFPPKIIRLFGQVREEHQGAPKGALKVQSEPEGLEVFINGAYRGVTPLQLDGFPAGSHVVRVEGSHYDSQVRTVNVPEGKSQTLKLNVSWKMDETSAELLGFQSSEIRDSDHLTRLVAQAGWEMGVARILLVSHVVKNGKGFVETQSIDTELKVSTKPETFEAKDLSKNSAEIAAVVAKSLKKDLSGNIALQSEKIQNRYAGDLLLVGRFQPLYKRPLFWAFLGASFAGGGVAGALAGAGAATGAIVVLIP